MAAYRRFGTATVERFSSNNQLVDTRFVTYPALGIGAAMVGFAQWGVAKQIAELRGELLGANAELRGELLAANAEVRGEFLAANAGLAKQIAEVEGKFLAEISGIKITLAEMKTEQALMKNDIANFSKKLDAR